MSSTLSSRLLALALTGAALSLTNAAHADSRIGISVGVPLPQGYTDIVVGRDHYYYHRGVFYRPGPHGYFVVRPPRGVIIRELPPHYARVYIGGAWFYRYGDTYYQPTPEGYVVVEPPGAVIVAPPAPSTAVPPPAADYQSVWVGDVEYQFKDGQFYKRTAEGMVWSPAPIGAITKVLPADAKSVWYQDIEYFECDEVCFRKTPDGYKVVEAPWKQPEPPRAK